MCVTLINRLRKTHSAHGRMPDTGTERSVRDAVRPRVKICGETKLGNCGEMGETGLPAIQNTGRLGEEATQPCGFSKGQRAWKLRPNRVMVAPQTCGTDQTRRAQLDQGVRGAEAESASATAKVSLRGGLRESAMLNPSGPDPWAAVRRARCSILCSRSRIRGTGTLQVSRRETTGKA